MPAALRSWRLPLAAAMLLPPPLARAIDEYRADDGVKEMGIGVQSAGSNSFAWLNRFVVQPGNTTITAVRIAFGGNAVQNNIGDGHPLAVYLWADPNQDGNPLDALVIASASGTVQGSGSNAFASYALTPPVTLAVGQVFFAGAIVSYNGQVLVGSLDRDGTDSIPAYPPNQHSFVASSDNGVPVAPNALALAQGPVAPVGTAIFAGTSDATWMIRLNAPPPATPQIDLQPNPIDFGVVDVATVSGSRALTLTNVGTASLTVGSISTAPAPFLDAPGGTCAPTPFALAPGSQCELRYVFAPTAAGPVAGNLAITSNAPTSPDSVALSGIGGAPAPLVAPAGIDFGAIDVGALAGPQTITLGNAGTSPWLVNSLQLVGAPSSPFTVLFASCPPLPFALPPGNSCDLHAYFAPTSIGIAVRDYELVGNTPAGAAVFQLRGRGALFGDSFD